MKWMGVDRYDMERIDMNKDRVRFLGGIDEIVNFAFFNIRLAKYH